MRLLNWQYLVLLIPAGYLAWRVFFKKGFKYFSTIKYPDVKKMQSATNKSLKLKIRKHMVILKFIALLALIIGLARPQSGQRSQETEAKGIDIILALDISGSMQAEDFKPNNRLYVAKKALAGFIKGRETDRIGLVVFAGESFTQCPLTLDYNIILEQLKQIKFGLVEDGTAIGMAIANSVNRLRYSKAKSKVIILLTDGINNAGVIDPITAADAASAFNIKIYAVGVGKRGGAPWPYYHPVLGKQYHRNPDGTLYLTKLDEDTLKNMAGRTGGKYFRATDSNALRNIYKKIDKLEKTKIKTKQYLQYIEKFRPFVFFGLLLLITYIGLDNTILIKVP